MEAEAWMVEEAGWLCRHKHAPGIWMHASYLDSSFLLTTSRSSATSSFLLTTSRSSATSGIWPPDVARRGCAFLMWSLGLLPSQPDTSEICRLPLAEVPY